MAALPPVDDDDDNDRRMLLGQGRADVADGHSVGGIRPIGTAAAVQRRSRACQAPRVKGKTTTEPVKHCIRLAKRRITGAF
ncbi:hypothetical protein HPB47_026214 [Ixodes persulcatus]|uniref:Uncharacterized protein n=1 Tax=Ixodes persulcatus TaxID=34615 RepID=A0AC60PZA7_IXOPE|nr:hypothetical protein HPB47_026214 [Ixodes persulcatus]